MDLGLRDCLGRVKLILQQIFIGLFSFCSHSRERKPLFYSQVNKVAVQFRQVIVQNSLAQTQKYKGYSQLQISQSHFSSQTTDILK